MRQRISIGLFSLLSTGFLFACSLGLDDEPAPSEDVNDTALAEGVPNTLTLRVRGRTGEVVVRDFASGETLGICQQDCTVTVAEGTEVELLAPTPSLFETWDGRCAGSVPTCRFRMPRFTTAIARFGREVGEQFTRILPGRVALSADFDLRGDLVVGTTAGLHKLKALRGREVWVQSAAPGHARVDPNGDIFVVSGQTLTKVRGLDGVVLFTRDLGPGGCFDPPRMAHTFATAPNGDVALQRRQTLRVFNGAGAERWSRTLPQIAHCAVAVNSQGIIHSAMESPGNPEPTVLARFTPDGEPVPDPIPEEPVEVAPQPQFAMDFSPSDQLLASSSGHSHVEVLRWSPTFERLGFLQLEIEDGDHVENGVAADATGHAVWAFAHDEEHFMEGAEIRWIDPNGAVRLTVIKRTQVSTSRFIEFGVTAHDVAADNGNFVVVGQFQVDVEGATQGGWVQGYACGSLALPCPQ